MIDRFRVAVIQVSAMNPAHGRDDYVAIGDDLLAPRDMTVEFTAEIRQRETEERDGVPVGTIHGIGAIREGVTWIYQIEINCIIGGATPDLSITNHFLERLPMMDIGLAVAARCSLTRWQEAHYAIEESFSLMAAVERLERALRRVDAYRNDEPRPVIDPPKPVLIDDDGVPWFRVQVVRDPMRALSRQKRTRVTPEFLRDVWTVYQSAREAGEPTTEAVREWADLRTGRLPSNPTIFRWIQKAKTLYGEDD